MRLFFVFSALILALTATLSFGVSAAAQEHSSTDQHEQTSQPQSGQEALREQLAEQSHEAAGGGHEGHKEFKESPSVKLISRITGLSLKSAYWVSIVLNFAILALLIFLISKSKLPAMFRTRTGEIQRGIAEARKASEDANRRLAAIEVRLSKLDGDVAEMRAAAEKEAAVEEQRILQAAEDDRNKIVQAAEAEIAAAAKMARRDLKAYTAELAIALAEKRIYVDAQTDRALVRNFVDQLKEPEVMGKDGK
ncbi:MAG TPA: ATP synthase F0 subunit B [Terriglobales bacterium]|nr:ATP synthase F0 subunit B [Terriglobales bacterium]